jgi:hypothetical protein
MSRGQHTRSRLSTVSTPLPYPTTSSMIATVDAPGNDWYRDTAPALYQRDFIFHARMQTARRLEDRTTRIPDRDRVLERLLEEGTFDRQAPDAPNPSEALVMGHSSAMVQRLLMRIEHLEAKVSR